MLSVGGVGQINVPPYNEHRLGLMLFVLNVDLLYIYTNQFFIYPLRSERCLVSFCFTVLDTEDVTQRKATYAVGIEKNRRQKKTEQPSSILLLYIPSLP